MNLLATLASTTPLDGREIVETSPIWTSLVLPVTRVAAALLLAFVALKIAVQVINGRVWGGPSTAIAGSLLLVAGILWNPAMVFTVLDVGASLVRTVAESATQVFSS